MYNFSLGNVTMDLQGLMAEIESLKKQVEEQSKKNIVKTEDSTVYMVTRTNPGS